MARSSWSSEIPRIRREADNKISRLERETAEAIAAGATANTPVSHVAHSHMVGRWRVHPATTGGQIVANDRFYAFMVEFGTVQRAPHPMLGPAAEAARPLFEAKAARIYQ